MASRPDLDIDGLEKDTISSGAVSGFATGVFSIPEGMAYASLAGVNPLYGLYSGLVSSLVASLTTGTVLMISTLTSAIALSTGSVLDVADVSDDDMPRALFTVTLLTGAVMLGLGLARMGSMVSFVSNSVMTGFVAAASVLIIVGELGDFSGYDPDGSNKIAEIWDWFVHIGDWDGATTAVGLVTVVLVIIGKRIPATEKLAPVIVLLAMTVAVTILDPSSVATVADIASIPRGLPAPDLPAFALIPDLALGSVSVAIVALVQGAGISTAYPNPDGTTASPSRDFRGQGLGNIAGSFFQSMPTGGSLSRTGISVGGGAKSRWGGIFAVVWLGVLLLLFGSLAELVPLAVIAGLLFVIAGELVVGRLANAELAAHSSWGSTAAMVVTFVAAMFIPLQWTIFIGAGLSLVVFIGRSFQGGKVSELARSDDGYWSEHDAPRTLTSNTVTVIGLRNWKFFADVPRLAELMPRPGDASGAVVVVRSRDLDDIQSTGLRMVDNYRALLAESGNHLVLAGVQPHVAETLERTGIADKIGPDHIFLAGPDVTRSLDDAWEFAHDLVAGDS
ncbi:SulP family inorganic anion transporter [Ilumatobacter nonamiensis]|uniref:SulP family inorganic anion transporter n=1 Tax=Ilumatobacter nonamiensis TaxID=467093 RepID=UPI00130D8F59|nr:SulP family inorganic anion transporter [Ilumatobacter nonamiensis]